VENYNIFNYTKTDFYSVNRLKFIHNNFEDIINNPLNYHKFTKYLKTDFLGNKVIFEKLYKDTEERNVFAKSVLKWAGLVLLAGFLVMTTPALLSVITESVLAKWNFAIGFDGVGGVSFVFSIYEGTKHFNGLVLNANIALLLCTVGTLMVAALASFLCTQMISDARERKRYFDATPQELKNYETRAEYFELNLELIHKTLRHEINLVKNTAFQNPNEFAEFYKNKCKIIKYFVQENEKFEGKKPRLNIQAILEDISEAKKITDKIAEELSKKQVICVQNA
jgi:hypothetical protein